MNYDLKESGDIYLFRGEYEFLSNFYPAKMFFKGIPYLNSEAAYQAQKCVRAGDKKQFSELSADEAKRLGSRVPLRPDWNEVKASVMERVICAKFAQHPRLAKKLLETGNKQLYEGNRWHDTFWGIDMKTQEGENHLGQILMDLRQFFRTNGLPDGSIQRPVKSYGPVQGITVTDEDITELQTDCVVNATDNHLSVGSGMSGAIHREAGHALLEECRTIGWCETGQAVLTGAYELSAKYVIHTVEPIYQKDDPALLEQCYHNCMGLAKQTGIHSIAFPPISTGKSCFPKERAMRIAIQALLSWVDINKDYPIDIILSCIDRKIYQCASMFLQEMGRKRTGKSD